MRFGVALLLTIPLLTNCTKREEDKIKVKSSSEIRKDGEAPELTVLPRLEIEALDLPRPKKLTQAQIQSFFADDHATKTLNDLATKKLEAARVAHKAGKFDEASIHGKEAAEAFERIARKYPSHPTAPAYVARAHFFSQRCRRAIPWYRHVIKHGVQVPLLETPVVLELSFCLLQDEATWDRGKRGLESFMRGKATDVGKGKMFELLAFQAFIRYQLGARVASISPGLSKKHLLHSLKMWDLLLEFDKGNAYGTQQRERTVQLVGEVDLLAGAKGELTVSGAENKTAVPKKSPASAKPEGK